MNLLFSCIGKRGYIAEYFRTHLRPGEKIIGTSNTPWTPGFRECDFGVVAPPIASDEYIPTVLDVCRKHEITGLLSFFDPDVAALSSHRKEFEAAGVTAVIPDESSARKAYDKWLMFLALQEAGLSVPDTVISLEDAHRKIEEGLFRFPLVVKPRRGFGSANVFVARNRLQMEAFFGYAEDMLIQEFVEGDAYNIDGLTDLGGRVLNVVVWRKYLSTLGETEQAMTVEDEEITNIGLRLAKTLGCVGPMDVDFIRTEGGDTKILDVNLRFGGGYPVSHLAGADFPGALVELLRGVDVEPHIGRYRRGMCLLKGVSVIGGEADSFFERLSNRGLQ